VSAEAFFNSLESRKQSRYSARKSRATESCPLTTGDILVSVHKQSSFEPVTGLSVNIAALGAASTDDMGVAEGLEKTPAAYTDAVQHAGTAYAGKMWTSDTQAFTLGANSVAVFNASVAESGALNVEIRVRETGELVDATRVKSILGTNEDSTAEATRLFDPVAVGTYTITAELDADFYAPAKVQGEPVTVVENQTVTCVLEVDETTWIEFKVRDMTDKKDLPGAALAVQIGEGPAVTAKTDAEGLARIDSTADAAECRLDHVVTDGDLIYEFIEIVESVEQG